MCHARDAILVCLDHRIPVLWKRDVSTLGLYEFTFFVINDGFGLSSSRFLWNVANDDNWPLKNNDYSAVSTMTKDEL